MLAVMDIGGTQCRLARFREEASGLVLEAVKVRATAELPDTDALLRAWEEALDAPLSSARALVMGVAGPVGPEGVARLSNAALTVDPRTAPGRFGVRRCAVVNDFITEAFACLTPVGARAVRLFGPEAPAPADADGPEAGPVAVLGAGTGLGTAWLVPGRDAAGRPCRQALASEFGHAPFPFEGREELEFADFAREALHRRALCADEVVTVNGQQMTRRDWYYHEDIENVCMEVMEHSGCRTPFLPYGRSGQTGKPVGCSNEAARNETNRQSADCRKRQLHGGSGCCLFR